MVQYCYLVRGNPLFGEFGRIAERKNIFGAAENEKISRELLGAFCDYMSLCASMEHNARRVID